MCWVYGTSLQRTLGVPDVLSSFERLSSSRRLKMNYFNGKAAQKPSGPLSHQKGVFCWRLSLSQRVLYRRFYCNRFGLPKFANGGSCRYYVDHWGCVYAGPWIGKVLADMKGKANSTGNKTLQDMKLFLYSAVSHPATSVSLVLAMPDPLPDRGWACWTSAMHA